MKLHKILFGFVLCSIAALSSLCRAASSPGLKLTERHGYAYRGEPEKGVNSGERLYSIHFKEWDDAPTGRPVRVHGETRSLSGQVTSTQEVDYDAQGKPQRVSFDRPDLGSHGGAAIDGDKLKMEHTQNGKTERDEEAANTSLPLVMGPDMGRFFRAHLEELKQGKAIELRMFALSRMRTFDCNARKVEEPEDGFEPARRGAWIRVKIGMNNLLYAALAPNMNIWLDAKTGEVKVYQGKMESRELGKNEMFTGTARYDLGVAAK